MRVNEGLKKDLSSRGRQQEAGVSRGWTTRSPMNHKEVLRVAFKRSHRTPELRRAVKFLSTKPSLDVIREKGGRAGVGTGAGV